MRSTYEIIPGMAFILSVANLNIYAQVSGGYTKAETDDVEVANAANFAMKAEQDILRKVDKDANVSLVEIIEASKQVVAGVNYKMKVKVNVNDKDRIAEIVVWKKLSGEYELSSWKSK
ncbi:MAG: cystatin domain-containing protein [Victivallales bacterium]